MSLCRLRPARDLGIDPHRMSRDPRSCHGTARTAQGGRCRRGPRSVVRRRSRSSRGRPDDSDLATVGLDQARHEDETSVPVEVGKPHKGVSVFERERGVSVVAEVLILARAVTRNHFCVHGRNNIQRCDLIPERSGSMRVRCTLRRVARQRSSSNRRVRCGPGRRRAPR